MTGPTTRLVAGCVLLVALVAGYVLMQSQHVDPAPVMLFAGPLVTYLILGSKVDGAAETQAAGRKAQNATLTAQDVTLAKHSEALATITRQTNGILDQRIREAAAEAVIKHLLGSGPVDPTANPEPATPVDPTPSGDLSP